MQLRYITSLLPAIEGVCKVTAITFSPNNRRLAVVTIDRVVHLFDAQTGERKDKFSTKPAEKGDKSYVLKALAFSPDSAKLAVAQSDNIVFIYKIGLEWNDKKSICNKFPQSASITSLTWPSTRSSEVYFGLSDGKVKVGHLRTNKSSTLYNTGSYVFAICSNMQGTAIISSHYDYSVHRYVFEDISGGPTHCKLLEHSCIPNALSWGEHIVVAGNDHRVSFHDFDGKLTKSFDFPDSGEFTTAVINPTGDAVVVGNFDSFYIFHMKKQIWEHTETKLVKNLYSITALAWKNDGSRVAIGSLCGAVDFYDACVRRFRYKSSFEFTYVSSSQVIIKRLADHTRLVIRSRFGCDIQKLNVFQDRYIIGNTTDTLIVGDFETQKITEIQWQSTGNEKYILENESVCIIYQAGELTLIEYGRTQVIGYVRTEHCNPHVLSIRVHLNQQTPCETIAYLLDLQTICVRDFRSNTNSTYNHDTRIDWLELNIRATLLLFRDRRRQLHLFNVETNIRVTLLPHCTYVQWVPDANVVVAQNRDNLCVWYNIHAPDRPTMYQIQGDILEIERTTTTQVLIDQGISTVSFPLNESFIAFHSAMDASLPSLAMSILDPLPSSPETRAMWNLLQQHSSNDLAIAERCAAALGDLARAHYLHKIVKIDTLESSKNPQNSIQHWSVRAKLALLHNDFKGAESILLSQAQVSEAIQTFKKLHKWDDAIRVAHLKNDPSYATLKQHYLDHLLQTRQEFKAAQCKIQEKDIHSAILLFLKGGYPAQAAQLFFQNPNLPNSKNLSENIAESLYSAKMYEKAGEILERMDNFPRALSCFLKANAFGKAIELARIYFPDKILRLEEAWGDYLVANKKMDMAINHYIEANAHLKAIEAALQSRQYRKAMQLCQSLDEDTAIPYYRRLARQYQDIEQFALAEQCFLKADAARDAVEMYLRVFLLENAYTIALNYLEKFEMEKLYIDQAKRMERLQKFREAEKLYLTVHQHDLAIAMHKSHRNYTQMLCLVTKFRSESLKDTQILLAQEFEQEKQLKEAEAQFVSASEWQAAVNMYRRHQMWEDAFRVAKTHGGMHASKRVAFAWATDLGGDKGIQILTRLGMIEPAIEYAMETGAFEYAVQLAQNTFPNKLTAIHLKHALFLEDEEKFQEAEVAFLKADKPKEALEMYIHQQDWENAFRVAETLDRSGLALIYLAQAQLWRERKEFDRAEELYIKAERLELALEMYLSENLFSNAQRFAKRYLPQKVLQVNKLLEKSVLSQSGHRRTEEIVQIGESYLASMQFVQAIDAYLSVRADQMENVEMVGEIWQRAIDICAVHDRQRYVSVIEEIASRFAHLSRWNQAAEYLILVGKMSEALDYYIQSKNYSAAQELCEKHAPELKMRLERARIESLDGKSEAVESHSSAMDVYMERGEWRKALSFASKQGNAALTTYLILHCQKYCECKEPDIAMQALVEFGIPTDQSVLEMAAQVAQMCLSLDREQEKQKLYLEEFLQIARPIVSDASNSTRAISLQSLCLISHYVIVRNRCLEANLFELAARISISLLRYCSLLPADKLFYHAGIHARQAKWLSAAFVYLNRYLDLTECIDDNGDLDRLDNSDFLETDVPSPNAFIAIPSQYIAEESTREEIRDWVLAISMDQQVQEKLPERACGKCNAAMYDAMLSCPQCKTRSQACIVSGFPIQNGQSVQCTNCASVAEKSAWNLYVKQFGTCPFCLFAQSKSS